MRTIIRGEIRRIAMELSNSSGETFTITSAEYEVLDEDYNQIEEGIADIESEVVSFLFDSTSEDYESCSNYYVYFTVEVDGIAKIIKGKVDVRLVR